jgi:hypothetical protein
VICKWADCTNQAVSSCNDSDLTYHLLHEHLRVALPSSTPLNSVTQSTPPEALSLGKTIGRESSQSDVNDSTQKQKSQLGATTSPSRENESHSCSGVHECKWKECGLFFPTCAELTTHITATHIGSGQAQYDCFWDQCPRNGSSGFQSKQKVCRHVQVSLSCLVIGERKSICWKSHTGHRPFQCTICQQYFSEPATLQQHIRRHTQESKRILLYWCDEKVMV